MSDIHVVIGMPVYGGIKMKTAMSLIGMVSSAKQKLSVVFVQNSYIHEARRSAVLKAQEMGATHLFFFDQDMIIPGDTIEKLLAHDKDIVGINYRMKQIPPVSTVKFYDENDNPIEKETPEGLSEVGACGTGAMLIRMSVFDSIDKPWFFYENGDDLLGMMGEDVWFCRQARRKGIKIWVDSSIENSHIGDYEY